MKTLSLKSALRRTFTVLVVLIMAIGSMNLIFAGISNNPNVDIVSVNEIPGIKIGHWSDETAMTGVTVIVCDLPGGATGGVSVLGGSPASRETDLLDPTKTVQIVNAIVLSGGSAFGLDSAGGVMRNLEARRLGVPVGRTVVPIVPTACVFDLGRGDHTVRPGIVEGYLAVEDAFNPNTTWKDGNVGGGTGAGAGGMKGGLGSFAYKFGDLYVGVVVVVNSAGNVVDPVTNEIIAGRRDLATNTFICREEQIVANTAPPSAREYLENTTIAAVITNARLNKAEANQLAVMAHDGFSRAIQPTHTPSDGDIVFVIATGEAPTASVTWGQETANLSLLGVLAVNAMERAIVSAAYNAETLGGVVGAATLRAEGNTPAQPPGRNVSVLVDVKNSPSNRFPTR